MRKEHLDIKPDTGCRYYGAFNNGELLGFVGMVNKGSTYRFKTDYIFDHYRGLGIYRKLFEFRYNVARINGAKKITAFCTPLSLSTYLKYGFTYKEKKEITFVSLHII